jgi:hypothetical protein
MIVGYRAQSTAFSTDIFVGDLELQLLTTAIQAALACDNQDMGNIARRLAVRSRRLMTETLVVGMYILQYTSLLNRLRCGLLCPTSSLSLCDAFFVSPQQISVSRH